MNEIYEAIENLISASGYPGEINGYEIYNEICDEIEGKENGVYIFMSKPNDTEVFEYQVMVMDEEFNLSTLKITSGDKTYQIDFDA